MTSPIELKEGTAAPDFTLVSDEGKEFKLSELKGKKIILYFYPKDMTPGCTAEACSFRDIKGDFEQAGAMILGVSMDDETSHRKFRDKHTLNFPLLIDTDAKVSTEYGAYKEKSMYGKTYMGLERITFVIDENGIIRKIYPKVKVDGHADDLLQFVRNLN